VNRRAALKAIAALPMVVNGMPVAALAPTEMERGYCYGSVSEDEFNEVVETQNNLGNRWITMTGCEKVTVYNSQGEPMHDSWNHLLTMTPTRS
jgi:hypothetical protein